MNDFLNQLSDVAKESSPSPETLTCHMAWPACAGATVRGEDYFRVAEKMDIVGITHYITALGASHFVASEVLDMAESAAACFGKHAWLIEYNARTDMAANEWERETYSAVGSGYKGIIYYQWRADYPYADGPEPEGFGMIFNDGRKTPKFERAAAMNSLVAGLGPDFVRAEKLRSGVGVLYSENVNAYYDALDNGDERDVAFYHERSAQYMKAIYADFRRARVSVDFIRAKELKENRIGVELLLVPSTEGLTEDERRKIEDFASGEGRVFLYHPDTLGYVPFKDENPVPFYVSMGGRGSVPMDAESVLEHCGIEPMCSCRTQTLDVKVLEAEQRYLVCLVNFDPQERPLESGTALSLRLPGAKAVQSAKMYTPEAEHELEFVKEDNGSLSLMLPALGMGAFIVLEKGASEK